MNDARDPLFASDLRREAVVCSRCGEAWDDRVVAVASGEGSVSSLCPPCLLDSQDEPYPAEPLRSSSSPDA